MADPPVDPPRHTVAWLCAHLTPVLRHAGWIGFFLALAPAIGPRGYGLFAFALSGVAIIDSLLAEVATEAIGNLAAVDERHWSTALVTTIVLGALASLLLYASSGAVGGLGDEALLADIFQSLALLPLLGGLSVVPRAALRREARPIPLLAASVAGLAAGGGGAVALAWAGAGPWSLVAQIVVQRLVEGTVLWGAPGQRIGIAWSRRHFVELVAACDVRAVAAIWPAVARHGPCLVAGLALGPTATGLYMLAARIAEAFVDAFLAVEAMLAPHHVRRSSVRVMLPAVLASGLLAIALPPLVDLRWWGAVAPAQVLLLGAIPWVMIRVSGTLSPAAAPWSQAIGTIGGIVAAIFFAPRGMTAMAAAGGVWTVCVALACQWRIRPKTADIWHRTLSGIARPGGGAIAAGLLLLVLSGPISLTLSAVPALCLLTAMAWLAYLVIRGEPAGVETLAARPAAQVP